MLWFKGLGEEEAWTFLAWSWPLSRMWSPPAHPCPFAPCWRGPGPLGRVQLPELLADGPVLGHAKKQGVVDVAGDGGWNVERMEALSPGLVLGSPAYDLSTRGWPMVPITEYLEAHPLGRAEWMVPLAWMMGDSSAGAQAFAGIRDRYEALVGQRMEAGKAPRVLMGSVADGVWHAPGQNTFVARWVEDAGGQYALTAEDHDSNVALGLEQVLEHAAQCDLWMMVVHDLDCSPCRTCWPKTPSTRHCWMRPTKCGCATPPSTATSGRWWCNLI